MGRGKQNEFKRYVDLLGVKALITATTSIDDIDVASILRAFDRSPLAR